ncbi:hypothetical protein BKA70DRAFT_1277791 [Coprinopsis sp. MPI-PUGE-AT-0042]|nr:hypothetical protein BKA70DRAFT_1277791 [Coprinopsis sp. MPI-PUGE-AT-0042]
MPFLPRIASFLSRNAAKAKGRDRTTRLQKDFFGKQKMNLMAKGLSGNAENFANGREKVGIQDISLAHAQQRIQDHGQGQEQPLRSWIPEPSHIGSSSSPARNVLVSRSRSRTSGDKGKNKAKVLQTLDLNEPIALRNLLERIRNTPDLTGLSRWRNAVRDQVCQDDERPSKRQKREPTPDKAGDGSQIWSDVYIAGSPEPTEQLSPVINAAKAGLGEEPEPLEQHDFAFTPASAIQESKTVDEFEDSLRHPLLEFSSMDIPESSSYMEDDPIENYDSDALPVAGSWSEHSQNSLRDMARSQSPIEGQPVTSIDVKALPNKQPLTPFTRDAPIPTFGRSGLPRVVLLSPPSNSIPVYGTLFEREDPWNTIGRILSGEEEAEWESGDDFESEQEDKSRRAMQAGPTSSPNWSCSLRSLFCTEAEVEASENEIQGDDDFEALVDEESDVEIAKAPESPNFILSPFMNLIPQAEGKQQDSVPSSSPKFDPQARSSPQVRHSPIHQRDGDGEESDTNSNLDARPASPALGSDMLVVPELEAVNGKFLGPSLFDFAEDSEEE